MQPVRTEKFEFEDKTYEIRVYRNVDGYEVKAFLDGERANGYSYGVDFITSMDMFKKFGYHAVGDQIETAKSDIKNKMWEKYVKACQEVAAERAKQGNPGQEPEKC